jgi:hypothetical protein
MFPEKSEIVSEKFFGNLAEYELKMADSSLYAFRFVGSVYYSENEGNTWNRIKGDNFKWGKRVELDPNDADKIFIVTFGGGVWYGPAKGDEQALEDIVNPLKSLYN